MLKVLFILIVLHGPDGREIDVSVDEITSLQCKLPSVEKKLFAPGVNAIINLTDGKFASVRETCTEIRDMINNSNKQGVYHAEPRSDFACFRIRHRLYCDPDWCGWFVVPATDGDRVMDCQ